MSWIYEIISSALIFSGYQEELHHSSNCSTESLNNVVQEFIEHFLPKMERLINEHVDTIVKHQVKQRNIFPCIKRFRSVAPMDGGKSSSHCGSPKVLRSKSLNELESGKKWARPAFRSMIVLPQHKSIEEDEKEKEGEMEIKPTPLSPDITKLRSKSLHVHNSGDTWARPVFRSMTVLSHPNRYSIEEEERETVKKQIVLLDESQSTMYTIESELSPENSLSCFDIPTLDNNLNVEDNDEKAAVALDLSSRTYSSDFESEI